MEDCDTQCMSVPSSDPGTAHQCPACGLELSEASPAIPFWWATSFWCDGCRRYFVPDLDGILRKSPYEGTTTAYAWRGPAPSVPREEIDGWL